MAPKSYVYVVSDMTSSMNTGSVKWFNSQKGFGSFRLSIFGLPMAATTSLFISARLNAPA